MYLSRVSINEFQLGPPEFKRYYILFMYSMIGSLSTNAWFTFSSVPDQAQQYYDLNTSNTDQVNHTIDILLNYGPIMYLCMAPFASYLLLYLIKGLRYNVIIAANLIFLGSLTRSIPSILNDLNLFNYKISNSLYHTLIFLHIGQILINAAGPFIMAAPSKLSVIWFPESQRKTATVIATMSMTCGLCLAWIIGPCIVRQKSSNFAYLLYVDLILIFIPYILIMIYFPSSPTKLPSIAAKAALLAVPMDQLQSFTDNVADIDKSRQIIVGGKMI